MCKINTLVFHHKNHKITFLPIKIFHICPFSLLNLNFKLSPFKSTIPLKTFFVHSFSLSLSFSIPQLVSTSLQIPQSPNRVRVGIVCNASTSMISLGIFTRFFLSFYSDLPFTASIFIFDAFIRRKNWKTKIPTILRSSSFFPPNIFKKENFYVGFYFFPPFLGRA